MTISATAVWEIRPGNGDNTNGAVFDPSMVGAGTDYTQQDGAQLSLTDINHTGGSLTITSVTGGFTTAMIGNAIRMNGGTNITLGWYMITSVTNTNTAAVDRSMGASSSTNGQGKVGGATKSFSGQTTITLISAASLQPGNRIYVKNESGWNESVNVGSKTGNEDTPYILEGYNTSRGDSPTGTNRPVNARASAAGVGFTIGAFWIVKNLRVTAAGSNGFIVEDQSALINSSASGCGAAGIIPTGSSHVRFIDCESSNNTGAGFGINTSTLTSLVFSNCVSHGNTGAGFDMRGASAGGGVSLFYCTSYANSSHGVWLPSNYFFVVNCTVDGNTGATTDGFIVDNNSNYFGTIFNCNITNNGRYGINNDSLQKNVYFDYNNFFGNGTAALFNATSGPHDLAVDPRYRDSANGDFTTGTLLQGSPNNIGVTQLTVRHRGLRLGGAL